MRLKQFLLVFHLNDFCLWIDRINDVSYPYVQVLDKYGDIYGRERIAELLGVDLASLDVSQQHGKKQGEPDNSVFAWYSIHLRKERTKSLSKKNKKII